MPTIQTCDVQASGGDETTIAAALSNIASYVSGLGLVANDEIYRIRVAAGTYAETLTLNTGVTSDATRRIEIVPQSGDEHTRTAGSGVVIQPTSGSGATITILDSFAYLGNVEVRPQVSSGRSAIVVGDASNDAEGVTIDSCLLWGAGNSSFTSDGVRAGEWNVATAANPVTVVNCQIWGFDRAGIFPQNTRSWQDIDQYFDSVNNTFWDNTRHIGYRINRATSSLTLRVVNNLGGNSLNADIETVGTSAGALITTGSSNNRSSRGSTGPAFPGADGIDYTIATSGPQTGDYILFTATGGTDEINFDALLIDHADNDVLDAGVGPDGSALVLEYGGVGVARAGASCDPGCYQTTVAASGVSGTGAGEGFVGSGSGASAAAVSGSGAGLGFVGAGAGSGAGPSTSSGSGSGPMGAGSGVAGTGAIATGSGAGFVGSGAGTSSAPSSGTGSGLGLMGFGSGTSLAFGDVDAVGGGVGAAGTGSGSSAIAVVGAGDGTGPLGSGSGDDGSVFPAYMPDVYKPALPNAPGDLVPVNVVSGDITAAADTIYNLTGNVGAITITSSGQRVRILGNGFTCENITINSDFSGPNYAEDIYIENIECVGPGASYAVSAPIGVRRLWLKNVSCAEANISSYGFFTNGHQGALGSSDIILQECNLQTSGAEAACRIIATVKAAVIDCDLGTPTKHALRFHGRDDLGARAQYNWASGCTFRNAVYIGYDDRPTSEGLDDVTIRDCVTTFSDDGQWFAYALPAQMTNLSFIDNFGPGGPLSATNLSNLSGDAAVTADWTVTGNSSSPPPSDAGSGTGPLGVGSGVAVSRADATGGGSGPLGSGGGTAATEGQRIVVGSGLGFVGSGSGVAMLEAVATGSGVGPLGFGSGVQTVTEAHFWDEMTADHQLPGSFGEAVQQIRLAAARAGAQRFSDGTVPQSGGIIDGGP